MYVRVSATSARGTPGRVGRVRELGRNHVEENSLKLKKRGNSRRHVPALTPRRPAHRDNALSASVQCSSVLRDDPDTKAGVVEATDASFGTPIAIDARS